MKDIFRLLRWSGYLLVVFFLFTPTLPLQAQWIQTNGPYGGRVYSLAAIGGNIAAGVYGAGLFLSTNNGTNWSSISRDITPNAFLVSGGNLFAGDGGVFVSTDNGSSWSSVDSLLTNNYVSSLAINGGYLFIGTVGSYNGFGTLSPTNNAFESNSGIYASSSLNKANLAVGRRNGTAPEDNSNWTGSVWRRPLSEMITSVKDRGGVAPGGFSLFQNYPNPFNPATTICYEVPTNGIVVLGVFDVLGREVETLVNSSKQPGQYQVKFDGSNLASGMYFCRLQAGQYTQTRKMLLVK
jgi:Secretion system C-terminal sorting domain